jgi:hypothetical protein
VELPEGARVTTALLLQGALVFALLDLGLLLLLVWLVKPARFHQIRRLLPIVTALYWFGLWLWVVTDFWESVYRYVFSSWSRWYLPPAQALLAGAVAALAGRLAPRLPGPPVLGYCLLGGVWGVVTHIKAVFSGIVEKPPLLQGTHPVGAIVIAFFEFTFYWCLIVGVSLAAHRLWRCLRSRRARFPAHAP